MLGPRKAWFERRQSKAVFQVADDVVVDRIAGRRIDPLSGKIYHVKAEQLGFDCITTDTALLLIAKLQQHSIVCPLTGFPEEDNPPPPEISGRVIQREDDTPEKLPSYDTYEE